MKDINWDEAPDDCVGAVFYKEDSKYKYLGDDGLFVTISSDPCLGAYVYCNNNSASPIMEHFDFIPKPETKPVYTQEMCDKGELPSVGMECLHTGDINDFENPFNFKDGDKVEVLLEYENGVVFRREKHDSLGLVIAHTCNPSHFKPLPHKAELIDGKAYQFHYGNSERVGFYNVSDDHFYDNKSFEGTTCHINMCTNIVPLVPEIK